MKKPIIIEPFQSTGVNVVDVDRACKAFTNNSSISVYTNSDPHKHTLVVRSNHAKPRNVCKTEISEAQANEIIQRLGLLKVKSPIFKAASSYYTRDHIESQIEAVSRRIESTVSDLNILRGILTSLEIATL